MGSTSPSSQRHSPSPIETRVFINNEFIESRETFKVYNPATEKETATVFQATPDLVDRAVDAAEAAFSSWAALDAVTRGKYIFKLADLLVENAQELSHLEAISIGKVTAYYPAEIDWVADLLRYTAGLASDIHGDTSLSTAGMINMTLHQPYGVCGAIIPWNGPLAAFAMKVGPALVSGNTLLLKPSEKSPLTALFVANLVVKAGFPPGVLNILPGFGHTTGKAIASHMRIRKLAFTGSARTGRLIKELAAKSNLKAVTLELGGKSPCIIFEDADLGEAIPAAAFSIANNSGQICMASSRVYVQESVAEKFLKSYTKEFQKTMGTVGDPLERSTTHAPQADILQFKSVMGYIEAAKNQGLNPVIGGKRVGQSGYFIEPTIFFNPNKDSAINTEEVFGPVVVINTFKTENEVLEMANDTEYGLYASVFTKDISRAFRFAKRLESGMVGINCTSPIAPFDMPFGGIKQSGDGREFSHKSLFAWTEIKTVMIKI